MPTGRQGSIRLFRFVGIDVFLHWSWFMVAIFEINARSGRYSTILWNIVEYLALFVIVLLHEFGHALACRQVGGRSNQIVLWPLGGVAYVDPPPRPGATLWSIVAGPLVNVVLTPILWGLVIAGRNASWALTMPNSFQLLHAVLFMNVALLIFNILPIYPLDGGQILRALLWFVMGRARSLMVATLIGFVGVAGLIVVAVRSASLWLGVLAGFILLNCWGGMKQAMALLRLGKLPQRQGYACPWCKTPPPQGNYWTCGQCRTAFDIFATGAVCPWCAAEFPMIYCLHCGKPNPIASWTDAGTVTQQPVILGSSPVV
jgi:Zn-dependent protease